MKKYIVFGYYTYYPHGGWNDLLDSFDYESDAITYLDSINAECGHVVDIESGNVVYHK